MSAGEEILRPCVCGYGCPPGEGCRYVEPDDPEPDDPPYCECGAVHSDNEQAFNRCDACGKIV